MHSVPVAWSKVDRDVIAHAVHDPVNGPRLVLVAWRVVRWDARLVEANVLVHGLDVLGVVLVGVWFRVVLPHPLRVLRLRATRVELDLGPVGVLKELGIGEANLLGAGVADETMLQLAEAQQVVERSNIPESDVRIDALRDVVLAAAKMKARCDRDGIFNGLCCAIAGSGKERVCSISNLDDTTVGRLPAGLRISPQQLEVDNGVCWCAGNELLHHGCPRVRANALVHVVQDLLRLDRVAPVLS